MTCHHLNLPGEKLSECWECHTGMYTQADFFKHDWHSAVDGANLKCSDCHKEGINRNVNSAKKCFDCHKTFNSNSGLKKVNGTYNILSYTDALHNLCVSCHMKEVRENKDKSGLARCSTCHKTELPENLTAGVNWKINVPHFNSVILPDVKPVSLETK